MTTPTGDAQSAPDPAAEVARLRAYFVSGATQPLAWRRRQLAALRQMLAAEEATLLQAIAADLARPPLESWITDIWLVDREIAHAQRNLWRWARARRVRVPLVQRPGRARVHWRPHGVSLVVAPWNYPLQLTLLPLASAIAAGNCVVLKPSELAPATAAALGDLVPRYLSRDGVSVLTGGAETTLAAIEAPVDHVFFTGSGAVGRSVLECAARHLTPVTLELGGKSPALVCHDADLGLAARKIVFGKFLNAGQTCVAPDYVIVEREVAGEFVALVESTIETFYGPNPEESPDYGRIVNAAHFERLGALLASSGGSIVGGLRDPHDRYLAPTLVLDPALDSPLMREEIFGPILPIVTVADTEAAIAFIGERAAPLVVYCFTRSTARARRVERATTSGGFCRNSTVEQAAVTGLPFGGVGPSGSGSSHGRAGFEAFSHRRSTLLKRSHLDFGLAEPPISPRRRRFLVAVLRGRRGRSRFTPGVADPLRGADSPGA